jgi:Glycosyltransferase family 92
MLQKWILFALFLSINWCYANTKYDLSICMVFRDEAPYLKEWIEFHRLLGAQHFYLLSHNSKDNYKEILKPYIKRGIVELKELVNDPHENAAEWVAHVQCPFYNQCIEKAKKESKWVAFLDVDEFLFPIHQFSLVEFLKNYEAFAGVAANWQMFGTSVIKTLQPDRLLIEQLIRCAPSNVEVNKHIKIIVQPKRVTNFTNPHYANYISGHTQVNTDKVPFIGPFSPYIQVDQWRINHYWTRHEDYLWDQKVPRQNQFWGRTQEDVLVLSQEYNQDVDLSIQRFVPNLRKKMKLD